MYLLRNKPVGELKDGILIKKGNQVHLFKNYNGFGQSLEILDDEAIKGFVVEYKGTELFASKETYLRKGVYYKNPQPPHDQQRILNIKYFRNIKQGTLL